VTTSSSPSRQPGDVTLGSYDAAAHLYLMHSAPPGPAVLAYLDEVARLVGDGTVLELGSGPGWDAMYLESRGPRVLPSDGAPAFVQMLQAAGHQTRLLDVRVDDFGGPYAAVLADAVLLHATSPPSPLRAGPFRAENWGRLPVDAVLSMVAEAVN